MESAQFTAAVLELEAMREEDRSRDLTDHIRDMLSQHWVPQELFGLRCELLNELRDHGHYADAQALLHMEIEREPAEPFHSLRLSGHFHYYEVDLELSLFHVKQAIVKSRIDGKFMYQALGAQARIALELQNWSLLEGTIRDLTDYEHTPGNVDVFPETDFISRMPVGVVARSVLDAYARRVEHLRSIGYSTIYGVRGASV